MMTTRPDDIVVSYLTLRRMIGWAGLLLPITVRLGAYVSEGIVSTDSISAYYYTGMRDVFVSTLVLVGALLACYRTADRRDNIVAIACGLAAIGIGLFPMEAEWAEEITRRFPQAGSAACYDGRSVLGYHYVFVAAFFALSFYLVYFRFCAQTPIDPTPEKRKRNRVYRLCGAAMAGAGIVIAYLAWRHRGASIFWPEAVAVVAFASAWLVKGQVVLQDPGTTSRRGGDDADR